MVNMKKLMSVLRDWGFFVVLESAPCLHHERANGLFGLLLSEDFKDNIQPNMYNLAFM